MPRVRHYAWNPAFARATSRASPPDWPMTVIREGSALNPQGICYCKVRAVGAHAHWREIPAEHCGLCFLCGAPGHARHHPGGQPCTGVWCDEHFARIAWTYAIADARRELTASCCCPLGTEESRGFPEFVAGTACGFCDDCGELGHTRPAPASVAASPERPWWAATRGWCDEHWAAALREVDRMARRPWWQFWKAER